MLQSRCPSPLTGLHAELLRAAKLQCQHESTPLCVTVVAACILDRTTFVMHPASSSDLQKL